MEVPPELSAAAQGAPQQRRLVVANTHDETNYAPSSTNPRGNLTTKTQKCFIGANACTDAITTYTYDETGQVLSMKDPCGNATCSDMTGASHTTTYSYADSYTSGTPSGNTNAYLTKITDPLGHAKNFSYSFSDGQLTITKDENAKSTSYQYNDPLRRLTETDFPDGGYIKLSYNDTAPNPSVSRSTLIDNTVSLVEGTTSVMDGVGHVVQTQLTTDPDPDGTDFTDTAYDGEGRVYTHSNPHRSFGLGTDGTTTYTYDSLGRTTKIAEPDGSAVTTAYSGNQTTVTDEVGNQRKSQTDALGRLTAIWEAPNLTGYKYETDYQYDVLSNLTCAVQKGTDRTALTNCASAPSTWRPRSFAYDSLSRLTSATNPEIGKITYSYDANGNLLNKIAPQPNQTSTATVTTNFLYDVLNRSPKKRTLE